MAKKRRPLRRTVSIQLLKRLQKVESSDVTYIGEKFPIVLKKGRGLLVTDVDGNRYLDFTACFGVLALGHRHPSALRALRSQQAQLIHGMGDVHPSEAKVLLLERLAHLSPFPSPKILLGLSGSDAVDASLKTAMLVTGRAQFVSFEGGYHGLTLGPLVLNGRPHFLRGFSDWSQGHAHVLPFPEAVNAKKSLEILTKLEELLNSRKVAAVVLEPLQGRAGERDWPEGFLAQVDFLAKKTGTLLIFDEIFSGLGRTGCMWAHEWHRVQPDLLCVGKALGGGLPLSACVGECMDVWGRSKGEARHTSTFLGHPLSCAVGAETLRVLQRQLPLYWKELPAIEREFQRFMVKFSSFGLEFSIQLRGRGFMRGLCFQGVPVGFVPDLAEKMLHKGIIALPSGTEGDVLSLTPPLLAKAQNFRTFLDCVLNLLVNKAGE